MNDPHGPRKARAATLGFSVAALLVLLGSATALLTQSCAESPPSGTTPNGTTPPNVTTPPAPSAPPAPRPPPTAQPVT